MVQQNPDLTDEQKAVLFDKATEAPFTGKFLANEETGNYTCANCGQVLFNSSTKYESTEPGLIGWPSFSDVADSGAVEFKDDSALGMSRVEVVCKNCGGHLGHVFDASDSSTGKHYCINSASLGFEPKK